MICLELVGNAAIFQMVTFCVEFLYQIVEVLQMPLCWVSSQLVSEEKKSILHTQRYYCPVRVQKLPIHNLLCDFWFVVIMLNNSERDKLCCCCILRRVFDGIYDPQRHDGK